MNEMIRARIMQIMASHRGRENAIPRRELADKLHRFAINLEDRALRSIYSTLPICSCDDGLFIPAHWYEVQDYLRYYGSHVRPELLKARAAVMTLAYHELMTRDVGPLFESEMEGARA
jgi:hypothetical protein